MLTCHSCWIGMPLHSVIGEYLVSLQCPSGEIIQGESCARSMQATAARFRPGSGTLLMAFIDICTIHV